jgi:hypothetical protein
MNRSLEFGTIITAFNAESAETKRLGESHDGGFAYPGLGGRSFPVRTSVGGRLVTMISAIFFCCLDNAG